MLVTPVKTRKILPNSSTLYEILDDALPNLKDGDVVAITSKIVSICEGSVVPFGTADKEALLICEADKYLSSDLSKYGYHFTITNNTLISVAGIDESNGGGSYILWPRNAQQTANEVRRYLADKHALKQIGVIITDSISQPLRRGTTGIALAHSGFKMLNNYIGQSDIFDRPFGMTQANVAGGLAAAAVLTMGEGAEQTPLCVLSDVPHIQFQDHDPTAEELAETTVHLEDDLFAPFLTSVPWQPGKRSRPSNE